MAARRNEGVAPNSLMSAPAPSAPTADTARWPVETTEIALARRAEPTRSPESVWSEEMFSDNPTPESSTSPRINGRDASGLRANTAMHRTAVILSAAALARMRGRGTLSESAPAIGPTIRPGAMKAALAIAVMNAESVLSKTYQPMATRSVQAPKANITAPNHSGRYPGSAKSSRMRPSGEATCPSTACPFRPIAARLQRPSSLGPWMDPLRHLRPPSAGGIPAD